MRAALLGILLLGACATSEERAQSAPPVAEDTCGMANFRHLIGTDSAAIDRAALPAGARIIAPNDAVTMDYRVERLNIRTDAGGRVAELGCF